MEAISVGDIFEGTVEKITSYGAFIRLENGLSGLVHISQMSTNVSNTKRCYGCW
ncbi:MAG: S1 RNA-binding domain-containing protein [Frisingicoccus sp.]